MLFYLVQDILKYIFFSVNYMQSTLSGMPDWLKHKLESRLLKEKKKRLLKEISIMSDKQMTPLLWQKAMKN